MSQRGVPLVKKIAAALAKVVVTTMNEFGLGTARDLFTGGSRGPQSNAQIVAAQAGAIFRVNSAA